MGAGWEDPFFLPVNTPTAHESCKFPQPRLSSGVHGIHRAHAANEEGILPREPGVIRGRASTLPPSPPPRFQPGCEPQEQASGNTSPTPGIRCRGDSTPGRHRGPALTARHPQAAMRTAPWETGRVETMGERCGGLETGFRIFLLSNSSASPSPPAVDSDCARACWVLLPSCGQRGFAFQPLGKLSGND